ncbi:hypothetical protein F2Q70_00018356 [Brassica cretica]|uniref:Uncharacterized protein n=1 Tax=Brassica cretica TaxID=69181 RepID=A0A8S9HUC7_BRACR|nr:hypothetical protein F2Q70_00018356 [Brassica cretica]
MHCKSTPVAYASNPLQPGFLQKGQRELEARRRNFQPTAAYSPSGHRATAHSPSGHCHITPSFNPSAIGHDPVYLSLPDPANKGFP